MQSGLTACKICILQSLFTTNADYVAAKATYIRLLYGKMGVFRP